VKKFFKKIFDKIDADSSGALDKHELEAAIEKLAKTVDAIPELPFSEQQVVSADFLHSSLLLPVLCSHAVSLGTQRVSPWVMRR
jgi:hypothetical protein